MDGTNTVRPDIRLPRGSHENAYRPAPVLARRVGNNANTPQVSETREGTAQMTNIIHVISKATIDYISQDPRGAAVGIALGVAVIIAKWAWNERKGKKNASTDCT